MMRSIIRGCSEAVTEPGAGTCPAGSRHVPGRAPALSRFRRAALAALLGLAAFAAVPRGASADPCPGDVPPRNAFWSACMTVGVDDNRFSTTTGYRRAAGEGGLSDTTVSVAGNTLRIDAVYHLVQKRFGSDRLVRIEFFGDGRYLAPPSVTAGWMLHIGSDTYSFDLANHSESEIHDTYTWDLPNVSWTEGQQITVSLTRPPAVHSAEVDGTSLVITFDQHLAAASSLANGAFEVKKRPSGGSETTVTLSDSPVVSGATVTLTLDTAVTRTDTGVKVSYTKPGSGSGNKLENLTGNEVVSFTGRAVTNALRWSGTPVLEVEVKEGERATFQWTPPGTPTAQKPVELFLIQLEGSGPAIDITTSSQTLTSKTAGTFALYGVEDDDWEDEVVHLSIAAKPDGKLPWRVAYVNVTVRDDDKGGGGCASAPSGNFWNACMRVGLRPDDTSDRGYQVVSRDPNHGFGSLSDTTVSKGGTHTIDGIVDWPSRSGRSLRVSFTADPRPASDSWVLKLGSRSFNLSDTTRYWTPRRGIVLAVNSQTYVFGTSSLGWGEGDKVRVSLFDIPKPTSPTSTAGDGQATLSWTAPSGVTVTDYEVRVCEGTAARCVPGPYLSQTTPSGYVWYGDPSSSGAADTSHTVSGRKNGVTYTWQVRAVTANGKGGWSDEAEFVPTDNLQVLQPAAPAITGVTPGALEATLEWRMTEAVEGITGWQVRYGEFDRNTLTVDDWGEWTDLAGAGGDARSYTVTGLSAGTDYGVELRAMVGALAGAPSAMNLISGVLLPVSGLAAVPADGAVALSWTAPSFTDEIGSWEARWKAADAAAWGDWTDIEGATATTAAHTVTGLVNRTRYALRVRAIAINNEPLAESAAVEAWAGGPPPPGAPGLLAEAGEGQVALTWTAPESVEPITGWQFRHGATGAGEGETGGEDAEPDWGEWTAIEDATAQTRAHTVTGLVNGTEYAFELRALAGELVGEASVRRLALPDEEEIPPFGDSAVSNVTATTVGLEWTLPEGIAATRLRAMQREKNALGEWQEWRDAAELALDATSCTVTGLSPATLYQFRIVVETARQSTDSGLLQQKTLAADATPEVAALTGFVLVDAATDADLGPIADGGTVSVSAAGSYGVRAGVAADVEVGSVVLSLAGPGAEDTHTQTENLEPYSLYGDAEGAEHGRALAAGSYTLTATAYAERGGAGEEVGTLTAAFTVAAEAAVTGFVLLDASDQSTVAALADGAEIDLGGRSGGSFAIRANVATNARVGSVALSLSGAKTVSATENYAPYSLYGDRNDGNGGRALDGSSLPAGSYTLSATAYAERRASGATLGTRSVSFEVLAPAALTVADARAEEGTDATLDFAVTLDRSSTGTVTVAYTTADGTATAGDDYTATSGTLTFAPDEISKTVSVPVLDDDHNEGSETLTLRLSSPSGATIADGEATGTITNSDHMPEAWLARFGRTVTGQVLEAVEERLTAPRQAGTRMSLAGQALPSRRGGAAPAANPGSGTGAGAGVAATERRDEEARAGLASMRAWLARTGPDSGTMSGPGGRGTAGFGARGRGGGLEPQWRALTPRDLIAGTSFALTGGSSKGGGIGSLWGRGSIAGFDGREGGLTVDGEVTTALIGADWSSGPGSGAGPGPGRWTAGLAAGHSTGTGGYRRGGECGVNCGGGIDAALTGLYPYAGIDLTERLTLWAAAGWGSGEVTMTPEGAAGMTADLTMSMGAAGLRGEMPRPETGEGLTLAVKGDARFTRTSSDAVSGEGGNLEASEADVWLVRTGVEGSRRFRLGAKEDGASGATLTPSFEIALRLDGGDAETGMGADLGGGLAFAYPETGLALDVKARGLVAHEASGFREWGASLAASWDPRPDTDRGASLTLRQSWGASPSGGMDALLSPETLAGLAANDGVGVDGFRAATRLEGEVGYGIALFGGAFTGTPKAGFGLSDGGARDWRIGWRLTPAARGNPGFQIDLDATRNEFANDDAAPEHGVMLRASIRW